MRPLHVLFHTVKRSKKILTTATPMVDKPSEIVPLMNLILPYNLQDSNDPTNLQFQPKFDFKNATLEQLIPYFKVEYLC